jgi:hypothetical protein
MVVAAPKALRSAARGDGFCPLFVLPAKCIASGPARVGKRTPRPSRLRSRAEPPASTPVRTVPEVAPSEQLGYTNAMLPGGGDHVTAVRITVRLAGEPARFDAFQDENPDGRLPAPRRDSSDAITF